jgi:hypothetical protein
MPSSDAKSLFLDRFHMNRCFRAFDAPVQTRDIHIRGYELHVSTLLGSKRCGLPPPRNLSASSRRCHQHATFLRPAAPRDSYSNEYCDVIVSHGCRQAMTVCTCQSRKSRALLVLRERYYGNGFDGAAPYTCSCFNPLLRVLANTDIALAEQLLLATDGRCAEFVSEIAGASRARRGVDCLT